MFKFNGNYDDFSQVEPWLDEFTAIYDEITERTGRSFVYNDDFVDRIPGIANKTKRPNAGTHEDAAIYMLQTLRRQVEQNAKVDTLKAAGFVEITELERDTKFKHVVFYPTRHMGEGWQEWPDARLIAEDGAVAGVLPKGKRTRGYRPMGRGVLALR